MKRGIFVTGTDTHVGKTVTSATLVSAFLQAGIPVGYWKPVQTGDDSDRKTVLTLSGLSEEFSPSPAYYFAEPMAPARAALLHQERIDLSRIRAQWEKLPSDRFWIVEGAGGLLVPLAGQSTIAELIRELALPTLVVARTQLGTMNHLLLTLESLHHRNLDTQAIIWVGDEDPGLEESLLEWTRSVPFRQRLKSLSQVNSETVRAQAIRLGDLAQSCVRGQHDSMGLSRSTFQPEEMKI